jgi:diadenosine tetraphosphate (Ap4A) HIT family hydrolase
MPAPASACKYCEKGALLVGMRLLASLPASDVMLLEDVRHPGRCVVAAKWHVRELFDLSDAQRAAFIADVGAVARTVREATAADKINIGLYGDLSDHLHAHVVPKHRDGSQWGDAFALQPQGPADPGALDGLAQRLRAGLQR